MENGDYRDRKNIRFLTTKSDLTTCSQKCCYYFQILVKRILSKGWVRSEFYLVLSSTILGLSGSNVGVQPRERSLLIDIRRFLNRTLRHCIFEEHLFWYFNMPCRTIIQTASTLKSCARMTVEQNFKNDFCKNIWTKTVPRKSLPARTVTNDIYERTRR